MRLHEEVGTALEILYGDGAELTAIAPQLARHFEEAGMPQTAIGYLHQAGDRAVRMSANEEAIAHYVRALALLETLPDTPERARQELSLRLALGVPLPAVEGYGAPEVGRVYDRAYELCQHLGETPKLFPVLCLLCTYYTSRGDYEKSLEILEHCLDLARQSGDPVEEAVAHGLHGVPLLSLGELTRARAHLEHAIRFYDPKEHSDLAFIYGLDLGVMSLSLMSLTLWQLGYPERAMKRLQEATALARQLSYPLVLAWAAGYAVVLHVFNRDWQRTLEVADAIIRLSTDHGFVYWQTAGLVCRGWALAQQGQVEDGIAQVREGIAAKRATGDEVFAMFQWTTLADAYRQAGQPEKGLSAVADALVTVDRTGERLYEAEAHRLRGELLLMQDDEGEAEVSFHQAIQAARQQNARSWELRAVVSLCRLWQKQGRREEAHQMLKEVYGWFTEGFDTRDLTEARTLLQTLSKRPAGVRVTAGEPGRARHPP
jgi:predicted ATPase